MDECKVETREYEKKTDGIFFSLFIFSTRTQNCVNPSFSYIFCVFQKVFTAAVARRTKFAPTAAPGPHSAPSLISSFCWPNSSLPFSSSSSRRPRQHQEQLE
jgi:hypothetical protein